MQSICDNTPINSVKSVKTANLWNSVANLMQSMYTENHNKEKIIHCLYSVSSQNITDLKQKLRNVHRNIDVVAAGQFCL